VSGNNIGNRKESVRRETKQGRVLKEEEIPL
jgi:hypothetical protein